MESSNSLLSSLKVTQHEKQTAGLNYFLAALALLSTTIGGGISQLPSCYFNTGFTFALIINILVGIQTGFSCYLYMQTREYTVGLESIAEIGYALIGRPAIFAFNGILVLLCLGSITIYFNLFGSVASGFFKSAFNKQDSKNFFLDPKFYILIAAAILIYPAFKRSIKELKIISIGLFSSIILLTFTMIVYIADEGTKYNNDHNLGKYWSFKFTRETVTALSVFIFSFSFQLTLFQTFNSLKTKTKPYAMKAAICTLLIAEVIYSIVSFAAVYLFGSKIQSSFLVNLSENPSDYAYIIQVSYIFIIVCHIPYVFFACKECTLTIVDEAHRRTISQALDISLQNAIIYQQQQQQVSTTEELNEQQQLQELEGVQELQQRLQFLDMNPYIYYGVILTIYAACVCTGLFVSNLGVVFELISAFTLSFLGFFWPASLYLLAEKKYGNIEDSEKRQIHRIHAWIQNVLGLFVFVIMIYVQF